MLYRSTRNSAVAVSSAMAIKVGLSNDGGLFVPDSFPEITSADIFEMSKKDYPERAKFILGKYLTDFSEDEIAECVKNAYNEKNFSSEAIAPLVKLCESAYILELWHGPTCAFKDMALQILPHLLTKSLQKTGEDKCAVILVATSGDTGKAALEGFRDVPGTKIGVFYPNNGVSNIQKLQMTSQKGENVYVCAIDGNFDNAQTGVKNIFLDDEYKVDLDKKGYFLSSANSINWGRLVPQIVYYFSAYCDLVACGDITVGEEINIAVPTGNFGNILAAFYAKRMGIPVKKLICASNSNNILTDFIKTGVYDRNREFYTTMSPSMDILISSNLERLLYEILNRDSEKIRSLMDSLKEKGKYVIPEDALRLISNVFEGGFCDDKKTQQTILHIFKKYKYTLDTHTAVAMSVYMDYAERSGDDTKTVIASTANPFKFNSSVLEAVCDEDLSQKDEFELLKKLSGIVGMEIPKPLSDLKTAIPRFPDVILPGEMKNAVNDALIK